MQVVVDTPTVDHMGELLKDPAPALTAMQDLILDANRETFETEGASSGTPWQPLSQRWVKVRRKQGKGTQMLRYASGRGGMLFRSLTQQTGAGAIREVHGSTLVVGSSLATAAHAQFGQPILRVGRRPVTVPVRPVTMLTAALRAELDAVLATHLVDGGGQ